VLQLLGSSNATGTLSIKGKYSQEPGVVYLEKGNPINASSGSEKGLDALFSLFGHNEGVFEFTKEEISAEKVIKKSRMEIILDGLQMLDEGQIETHGPVSFDKAEEGKDNLPIIRGPLVDYMYVVEEETFHDGSAIVLEGNLGNWFYVILEGAVEIEKETPEGPMTLLRVGTGSFIGSLASFLIGDNVRSATALAVGDVVLGMLDSQRLYSEFVQLSPQFKSVIRSMDNRLKEATMRLVELNEGTLDEEAFVQGKKLLIEQGAENKEILQIKQGEVAVVRIKDKISLPMATLGVDDFIGHFPFFDIGQEPYSASIYASEDLETAAVDLEGLQKEYETLSTTFRNIIENVATSVSITAMRAQEFQKKNLAEKSQG
jgi:CRP-like cAMP-binding protein